MEFTKRIQSELEDTESLRAVFDFDLNSNLDSDSNCNLNNMMPLAMGVTMDDDEQFVDRMASEIDGLWSEYTADLHAIGFEQEQFEAALLRREEEEAEMAKQHVLNS